MCTIENDRDQIQQALSAGVDEYLTKPFNKDTLSAKLAFSVDGGVRRL